MGATTGLENRFLGFLAVIRITKKSNFKQPRSLRRNEIISIPYRLYGKNYRVYSVFSVLLSLQSSRKLFTYN